MTDIQTQWCKGELICIDPLLKRVEIELKSIVNQLKVLQFE